MEKRFVVFLVLAIGVIVGHLALVQYIAPPRPKEALKGKTSPTPAKKDAKGDIIPAPPTDDKSPAAAEAKPESAKPESGKSESAKSESAKPDDVKPAEPVLDTVSPAKWASLGSFAADSPYPMLVTFTSRGAAVERIEFTERKASGKLRYRNLEEHSGYIGNLALSLADGGCQVNVVGNGTPAQKAKLTKGAGNGGLQVGDIITQIDKRPMRQPADLADMLVEKHSGEKLHAVVRRIADGAAKEYEFEITVDERPFELVRPERISQNSPLSNPSSLLMSLVQIGSKEAALGEAELPALPSLRNKNWEVRPLDNNQPGVEFRFRLDTPTLAKLGVEGDLEIVKRYRLSPLKGSIDADGKDKSDVLHHLRIEVELVNHGTKPLPVAYRLDGPNGLTLEGWWYLSKINPHMFSSAGARDVIYRTDGALQQFVGNSDIIKYAQKNTKTPDRPIFAEGDDEKYRTLQYAGIDTQYFLAALIPQSDGPSQSRLFRRGATNVLSDLNAIDKARLRTTNVSFYVTSQPVTLQPGQSLKRNFILYAGPKEPNLLATYGLNEAIYYGWFWWVAKPLSHLLHFFYSIVRNYGIAIIMLTVIVRGCMFPLSRKAASNAAMMQELAPEMRKIAEKYKNDMEKRAKAQQELFRKNNYNPLSGCWLMFLQLPVFIGLYRSLAVDIELRQAPLIPGIEWASNLAGPDMLFYWEKMLPAFFGSETGMLGPYLNLLPICTMVLFLVHQQLFTPPATDEQTRMQMQMMKFMTIFIGFMFFKVASGLCLYFIASSLWSVAERVLVPKPKKSDGANEVIVTKPKKPDGSILSRDKGPNFFERLREKVERYGSSQGSSDRRRPRRGR